MQEPELLEFEHARADGSSASPEQPLFNDRSIRNLRRVGIVDVGSNSVRLVVFDGAARSPAYFYNEKILCGLGASLPSTGKLDPQGRQRALRAIKRFALLGKGMELSRLIAVGTAAVRNAQDGMDFCEEVEHESGVAIHVASGEEEARLAAQGVLLGWPTAEGLVCDLGGASTELTEVSGGTIGTCLTTPVGSLTHSRIEDSSDGTGKIASVLEGARDLLGKRYRSLYLVGGSWRALARLDMDRRDYPLKVLNEYRMSRDDALATIERARELDFERLRQIIGTSSERVRGLPAAGMILEELVEQFEPEELSVSAYGIREGLLYGQMPEKLKSRDPLIEACLHAEHSSARLPGFGDKLFKFVRPLFKNRSSESLRLIRAACLLHDVTWRAHPDYRAEICFDNATRANLGGLDHQGRVFIALALFNRYRQPGISGSVSRITELLCSRDASTAIILGKAMRFGAMFAAVSPEKIGKLKFKSTSSVLTLLIPDSYKDIFGEVVEMRFKSLARAMDCTAVVEIV